MTADDDKKRTRSPAYPSIDLEEAIHYAGLAYKEENRHSFAPEAAAVHWGYKPTSSAVGQIISALKQFGLLLEEPGNGVRRVRLSPLALDLLVLKDQPDPDPAKCEPLLQTAALNPKIHREIWDKYDGRLPSDPSLKFHLLREREVPFNKDQVDRFISQMRSTIGYAKLLEPDSITPAGGGGSESGRETQQVEESHPDQPPQQRRRLMQPGAKEDVFTLEEGPVVIQYPERLSPESFEDFESWLQLIIRKAKRSVRKEEPSDEE